MTRRLLHAPIQSTLKEGEVYAIELFSTQPNAVGLVVNGPPSNIYAFRKKRGIQDALSRQMLKFIQLEYGALPFASRWLLREYPGKRGVVAFDDLLESKCIYSYPQLIEKSGATVAQAEHTIIVTKDDCIITTDENQSSVTKTR